MFTQVELSRIVTHEHGEVQIIFLKEKDGPRTFPIIIGLYEAAQIRFGLNNWEPVRPLTYDFILGIAQAAGIEFRSIEITCLVDNVYFAKLNITINGENIAVDCRPSDAIALAYRQRPLLDIFVHDDVFKELELEA